MNKIIIKNAIIPNFVPGNCSNNKYCGRGYPSINFDLEILCKSTGNTNTGIEFNANGIVRNLDIFSKFILESSALKFLKLPNKFIKDGTYDYICN